MKSNTLKAKKLFFYTAFFALVFFVSNFQIKAQTVVDKTVATVSDGVRTELVTYSDLLWQLALQPNVPLDPPSSETLNRALQLIINQRLFALEAERLPRAAPTQEEINKEIQRILQNFPSTAAFENRLRTVGFDSVRDDNFERIISQRVAIEKYLDFRFRSFTIVTGEDEEKYYREVYTPEFRRRNSGLLLPPIDEVREQINEILKEEQVAVDIESFLDNAKRRAEIIVLSEV